MSDDPTRPPDHTPRSPDGWVPAPSDEAPRPADGWVPPAPPPPQGGWALPDAGDPQPFAASYVPQPGYAYGPMFGRPTYQPGLGKLSVVPPEASGWNWGAFFLSWIWGLFNGAYVTLWGLLLWFVPPGVVVWAIICGASGSRWAWQGKTWSSIEQFRATQRRWAFAGLVVALVAIAVPIVLVVLLAAERSAGG